MYLVKSIDGNESQRLQDITNFYMKNDMKCIYGRTATPMDARWVSLNGFIVKSYLSIVVVQRMQQTQKE